MIGYIDDFALMLIVILASLPLLLLVRVPSRQPLRGSGGTIRSLPQAAWRWHAVRWPGAISRSGGSSCEHCAMAKGHRV